MLTSTSFNASFIAKLVHAANVAIATESYCEIQTSKGKPSVLVEYDKQSNSLMFTHISGQDVTGLCWQAVGHLVCMPSVELVSVPELVGHDEEQPSHAFLSFYLLTVILAVLACFNVLSVGSAVLLGGAVVASARLAGTVLDTASKASHRGLESRIEEAVPACLSGIGYQ